MHIDLSKDWAAETAAFIPSLSYTLSTDFQGWEIQGTVEQSYFLLHGCNNIMIRWT